ncbi:MAG: LysM peptidoglycan-binding domain-containing protein [Lachnospiraceae bacterium]|nr:LysM peptidoglycan-binding domain-containing protein [Lachnospiraceae bacterium]
MSAFFYNYAGRILNTCGTGAAKGTIADGCWQKNAGNEFMMIWNPRDIQAGDIAVYSTGQWGHIGMAMGGYNNGYFALLGQNQGGRACPGGGAAGNIINLSTRDFIGAFRPKAYIKPEPAPTPDSTPAPAEDTYTVRKGDTLGGIAYKLGWYTGKKMFGDDGYAQSLAEFNGIKNRGLIYPGQVIKRK